MKCAQPSGPEMGHLTVMNWSPTAPMHLGWSDLNQPLTPKTAPSSASRQLEFGDKVQLFTGAHEIGHLVLHEDTVMHRDRAFDGSPLQAPRAPAERQADRFAASFLMPQKLLRERFEFMFCCKGQLRFSDVIAYHLDPNNPDRLLYSPKESGERELALARCTRFNNQHLVSLAQQFGVSDSAMAIRLKELELVRWP